MQHCVGRVGLLCLFGVTFVGSAFAADRPTINALRLPAEAIVVDGRADDWYSFAGSLEKTRTTAADAAHSAYAMPERGVYAGADDCAITCYTATDAANLYILADVRDQVLINDAGPNNPFEGDDFELFIDANPPDARFAEKPNANVRQFIFVPGLINRQWEKAFVWNAAQYPGVRASSRLRPWGYTIEVAIPKALFPYWKEHPELEGIGFDAMASDADAPGVDRHHPALKHALFLLQPNTHFQTPQKLGLLQLAALPPSERDSAVRPSRTLNVNDFLQGVTQSQGAEESLAQMALDVAATDVPDDSYAAIAIKSKHPVLQRAGVLAYAKRPGWRLPLEFSGLQSAETPASDDGVRIYHMIALAERRQFPLVEWLGVFPRLTDPATRLTIVWCAGQSSDPAAIPALALLTGDANLRIRNLAAMGLATLGARAALPTLKVMAKSDPHPYGRSQASLAIEQIEGKKP